MFTAREQVISQYLKEGLSNKEIAFALGITERGVKFHVGNLLEKTGANTRYQLARLLLENNAAVTIPSGGEDEPELRAKLTLLKHHKQSLARRQRMVDRVITACETYLLREGSAA